MANLYQEARATLHSADFKPRKRLGQHFLVHDGVIENILRLADLSSGDEVLEIGPGLGFLTRRLLAVSSQVWAVEVDPFLVGWLRKSLVDHHPGLHLIHGDILKVPLEAILADKKVKVVANLPYNISTPILFRLFELRRAFSLLVLMVQQEVAERMIARPATQSYGALSVAFQVHGKVVDKLSISPEAFFPRPKVRSTVLKIVPYPDPLVPVEDAILFRDIVRGAFGQRRKTLNNSLAAALKLEREEVNQLLQREGIDPRRRGETLSIDEFMRLTQALKPMRP